MEKEIRINGSKLKIESIVYSKGDSVISGIDKKALKYQMVLFYDPDGGKDHYWKSLDISGKSGKISVPAEISSSYTKATILTRLQGKKFKKYDGEAYSKSDSDVILSWIGELSDLRLDTAETLIHALKDDNVARMFYSSYGMKMLGEFKKTISEDIIRGKGYTPAVWSNEFSKIYQRNRYSVCELMKDLVDSGVMIYTDPELIGKYNKISRCVKDGSKFIPDRWSRVIGVTGNKTRANLSLTYMGNVFIDIPKNSFGIPNGHKELKAIRSFCLVADGMLNMKQIGIKTTDKDLLRKLRGAGVIESPLILDDEYLLDLTKIPVAKKMSTRRLGSRVLGTLEADPLVYGIILGYLRRLEYMKSKGVSVMPKKMDIEEESEKDKFLHSLGIYDGMYYPPKTEVARSSKVYTAVEVKAVIKGIPSDPVSNIINFINTGSCRNTVIKKILSNVKDTYSTKSLEELRKEIEKTEKQRDLSNVELRDYKFRMILGKTLRFYDSKMPRLETTSVTVKDGINVSWEVSGLEVTV